MLRNDKNNLSSNKAGGRLPPLREKPSFRPSPYEGMRSAGRTVAFCLGKMTDEVS